MKESGLLTKLRISLRNISSLIIVFFIFFFFYSWSAISNIEKYIIQIQKTERQFVENIPIYEDYATPDKEQNLRKYLNDAHIRIAESRGIGPVKNEDDRAMYILEGALVAIEKSEKYFFYNVDKNYRYLTSSANRGLNNLCSHYQDTLNKKTGLPPVKIAISSALRPSKYQDDLKNKNPNASLISTHSYGTTIDIFYDEYYVLLPETAGLNIISNNAIAMMRTKLGYTIGSSLRRQLRTALVETLLDLQEKGALYVIQEKNQRCYHVTFIEK